ncbi:hypothetical protein [Sulfitobacter donghicola]|uniref:Aspartate carbamoyltransferase catalytic subunit n=1 Tax=Sulfitobacter donghicola DSW-25 = KCTC 12864 = JCM 14565 TaxID=1300350 RepID=A0A073IG42_9RHOB|nr:hypothetical protein [Sulfitobacter donghicola]KEJ88759.1 hypothetical protein DSW25_14015 [Sulfitobacter donghicola DSW-25 = KCTC 12864 = JCM 14565]KIN68548.1 hypothetical protein Z948_2279 [Sulfitobacter donghicola DSW-25 = KCTC 12864 = JCM 14565]
MTPINIRQTEHGVIRVFAISRPMADMARALKQASKSGVASALLKHPVADNDVELFALSDLAGVGLPDYLINGHGMEAKSVQSDRIRLEALDGYVLFLFSSVSDQKDISFTPSPDLTLIGTYGVPPLDMAVAPIAAKSAAPYSSVSKPAKPARRAKLGSAVGAFGAIFLLFLIWWIFR